MAKAKVKIERFDKINRSKLTIREAVKRTRTGAYRSRIKRAHGKHYKHT